jgi:hypothetical protein
MVTDADLIRFCAAVLGSLGIGVDHPHLVGPLAWCYAEGGWQRNAAQYNPWNTTLPWPGSVPINAVGVQSYPGFDIGLRATVATLRNGDYPLVLRALADGDAEQLAAGLMVEPWGTSGQLVRACIPRALQALGLSQPTNPPTDPKELPMALAISADGKTVAGVRTDGHLIVATAGPSGSFTDAALVDLSDRGQAVDAQGGPWTFAQS